MHAGQYISGAGHLGLIGWLLLGGLFAAEPEPIEMTEVSVISGADFDALMAAQQPPQSATEVAQPAAPETPVAEPEVAATPDVAIEQPAPIQTETPPEDIAPEVTELELPPETEVEDVPPELNEPAGDLAVLVPEVAPEAAPRPVERVAPEPVAQPDPEATPDVVEQEAVTPDTAGDAPEQESQEATAPQEAEVEIVTEATAAPAASSRPPGRRPDAPTQQSAAPAAEGETDAPEVETGTTSDPVNNDDVLAALAAAQETPSGPPLSRSEKDGLKAKIAKCWNVGALSTEAKATIITVALKMNRNNTPDVNSIRLLRVDTGRESAAQTVFRTARSAIARCGNAGFNLPEDKFSQWQNIEITFDASKMGF